MRLLVPVPVALPLVTAAVLVAGTNVLPRRVVDGAATLVASAVTVASAALLIRSQDQTIAYWFGGWTPRRGIAIGVQFAIDPIGAGLATLAGVLATSALLFSWRYFEAVGSLFHALVLVFLGGMVGFALTGDLFNLFVFFELIGVAAYALTGYRIEEAGPLQGALNFAVTNSAGGFLVLFGIALVYGRTGALNMAQAGREIASRPADGLVVVAFALVIVGFLVKGAVVPFHFWLADAHAVAPTPVCVLFSGVMVELGLYAVARVSWTVFGALLGPDGQSIRGIFLFAGGLTAVIGSVMCFEQRHVKRMLAFSTVAHGGVILIAIALAPGIGLAGAAVYVLGHGLVKGSLFLGSGVALHRLGTVEEEELWRRRTRLASVAGTFVAGGLALAGMPPFATSLGKDLVERAASDSGVWWVTPLLLMVSLLTGGAVARAGAKMVLTGAGRLKRSADRLSPDERETHGARGRTPAVMLAPMIVLVLGALVLGLWPGLAPAAAEAASRLRAPGQARALVHVAAGDAGWDRAGIATGVIGSIGAIAVASASIWADLLSGGRRSPIARVAAPPLSVLRRLHSGHVGDYALWLALGTAALAGVLSAALR